MNVESVLKTLTELYPDSRIIQNKDRQGNVTEIICEVYKSKAVSEAIAVIDKTIPHSHKLATEIYEVIRGKLVLNKGKEKLLIQVGDSITIEPGEVHSAEGQETWLKVTSRPGWNVLDHVVER